ncbi:MAG TPA: patatin family protein, partial [Prevotella sp.]
DKLDVFDSQTFDMNPTEFYAVCTDMQSGNPVYRKLTHHNYACNEWIRASASMPLVSRVVHLEGLELLDGGVSDSIPLRFFEQMGYEHNLVVLTQPAGYVKRPDALLHLMKLWLRKYPAFLRTMANRPMMYNAQLAYVAAQEAAGQALVLRPSEKLKIGHTCHDPQQMQQVYEEGRQVALNNMEAIRRFMGNRPTDWSAATP